MTVHEVHPYLRVQNAGAAIDFYARAFGAKELYRLTEPSGHTGHAEITIGTATLMLAAESPENGFPGPRALGGTTFALHLHVADVDSSFAQAVNAGATVVRPLKDQFYGERTATVRDPFGHEWVLGSDLEKVSPEEMQRRYTALFS